MEPTKKNDLATEVEQYVKLERLLLRIFRLIVRRAPDTRDQAFVIATLALMFLESVSDDPIFHNQISLKLLKVIANAENPSDNQSDISQEQIESLLALADADTDDKLH